jgi:hypothetical protein
LEAYFSSVLSLGCLRMIPKGTRISQTEYQQYERGSSPDFVPMKPSSFQTAIFHDQTEGEKQLGLNPCWTAGPKM